MMSRPTFSRRIVTLVGIAAVAAAAATVGCFADEASNSSVETIEPTTFPPATDARVKEILFEDGAIKAMLAGREEGRNYWIRISYVYEHMEAANTGEKPIAMVHIYFDPPASYAGEVPVIVSDPCSGHRGPDGRLDPDDPCMSQPKEYESRYRAFTDAQGIVAQVDLRRGGIVEVFQAPVAVEEMEDIQRRYGQ